MSGEEGSGIAGLLGQIEADPEGFAEDLYQSTLDMPEHVPVEPFLSLDGLERESAVWKKIEGYLEERLDAARESNDTHKSGLETATIRGKIAIIKDILGLGQGPLPEDNPEPLDQGY